jgi:F-type H+-transporting ATPase subunit c
MKKLSTFAIVMLAAVVFAPSAFAQDAAAASGSINSGLIALASALAIGIAAIGGAAAQGRAVTAALEAIGRNPGAAGKITTPMIIGLALIESLVIYALVIAIILSGNVGA